MDEFSREMNYSDKVNLFIDGELPQEEATELFYAIADNPELQEEFKQSLVLKNLMKQDLIAPPPYLKEQLLAKFNLQKTAIFSTISLAILAFLRRYLMNPIAGGIIFGGMMFLLGYFLNPVRENNELGNISTKNNISNNNIPIVSSKAPEQSPSESKQAVVLKNRKSIAKDNFGNAPIAKTNFQKLTVPNFNVQSNNQPAATIPGTIYNSDAFVKSSNNSFNLNPEIALNKANPYYFYNFLEKVSISFNKNFFNSNIKSNLEPLSNPMLNNFSMSLAYSIDPRNSFSIEYGQENFTQKFSGKINGNNAEITQVYTAQYAGVGYRHYFPSIESIYRLNPYTKLFVGGTQVGTLGKIEVGLNYNLSEKMSLLAGFETSALLYKFQNQLYNSMNYGLVTGLTISFR
jgi:hypothetical protein